MKLGKGSRRHSASTWPSSMLTGYDHIIQGPATSEKKRARSSAPAKFQGDLGAAAPCCTSLPPRPFSEEEVVASTPGMLVLELELDRHHIATLAALGKPGIPGPAFLVCVVLTDC